MNIYVKEAVSKCFTQIPSVLAYELRKTKAKYLPLIQLYEHSILFLRNITISLCVMGEIGYNKRVRFKLI